MSSRNICLLPRATLHSDSEQAILLKMSLEVIHYPLLTAPHCVQYHNVSEVIRNALVSLLEGFRVCWQQSEKYKLFLTVASVF
jgi:hypothetical protein